MFVKDKMTTRLLTVTEDTPVLKATQFMRENKVRRLPVVKGEKLVGIVTEDDLLRVSPSAATSLSIFEVNHLLSELRIKEVMTKKVITISPEATLEEAALLMRENEVGALPVVEGGKLVGIITESNIFDAFIEMMGLKKTGARVTINAEDRMGVLAEITEIIKAHQVNIVSLATFPHLGGRCEFVFRLDTKDCKPLLAEIERKGYKVTHLATLS